jgi:hypothetical protein
MATSRARADLLDRTLGPALGPYADDTYNAMFLHCHDELSHHGAEISLLRDLWAHR